MWQDRVDAIVISGANEKDIIEAKKELENGASVNDINIKLNTENQQKVIITNGVMELGHQILPKDLELKVGISEIYELNDAYHIAKVTKIIPKSVKTFEESKGNVINDFQNEIEKNWLATLRERFKVDINKKVLAKVKSQINQ
jgi:peptidyl-prolyl cis-trans isomerase SurA